MLRRSRPRLLEDEAQYEKYHHDYHGHDYQRANHP